MDLLVAMKRRVKETMKRRMKETRDFKIYLMKMKKLKIT
jgi:hypothetical protein